VRQAAAGAALACACSFLSARAAAADDDARTEKNLAESSEARDSALDGRTTIAFVTGSLLAAVPFGIGATITSSSHEIETNNAGVITLQSGFLVAPMVSHAIVGEWGRGAIFSILPALSSAGMAALLASTPTAVTHTTLETQRYFYLLVTGSVVGGTIGVVDSLRAPARERARERERERLRERGSSSLWIAPILDSRTWGIGLGGFL
jgi:hypothetical protein